MLKNLSRKIMSGFLAASMVVTLMPATPAQAAKAATLSGKTAAVSGTTYNYTVKNVTSSQYIKVKLSGTATSATATVAKKTVKNGKTSAFVKGTGKDLTFKVAAKNAGKSYKLTVKVYKKDKKTVVKTLTTTAKVYSHSISKITGSTTVEVGKKVTLKAVKKYSQSKKAVTWASSKTSVATVGKTTGVVTGKKAGTATITATCGTSKKTVKVTVKAAEPEEKPDDPTKPDDTVSGDTVSGDTVSGDTVSSDTVSGDTVSGDTVSGDTVSGDTVSGDTTSGDTVTPNAKIETVKQIKYDTFEVVISNATATPVADDFTIKNVSTNIVNYVKSVVADKNDKTKFTVTLFNGITDGKLYSVELKGIEGAITFVASDGKPATLGLDRTTIPAAVATTVQAYVYDTNGVIIKTLKITDTDPSYSYTIVPDNGYLQDDGLYLYNIGDTATATVKYISGYDSAGNEVGISEKITIKAVQPTAVSIKTADAKIGESGKTYATVTEKTVALGDTDATAYFKVVNSEDKEIVYTDYTVKSSNTDVIVVDSITTSGQVKITPVAAGNAYIILSDKNNNVIYSKPVTVAAKRIGTTLAIDKTTIELSNGVNAEAAEVVKLTVKDQYGNAVAVNGTDYIVECKTGTPASTVSTNDEAKEFVDKNSDKVTFSAYKSSKTLGVGTYTYAITYDGRLTRTVTVTVKAPDETVSSNFAIELSDTTVDAAIVSSNVFDKALAIRIQELKKGVVAGYVAVSEDEAVSANVWVYDAKGKLVTISGDTAYAVSGDDSTTVAVSLNKVEDSDGYLALATGAYTVKATVYYEGKNISLSKTFTVTNSQPAVTVTKISDTIASGYGELTNLVEKSFAFTYDGKTYSKGTTTGVTYETDFKVLSVVSPTGDKSKVGDSVAVTSATIKMPLGGNKYVVIPNIAINKSVTIK